MCTNAVPSHFDKLSTLLVTPDNIKELITLELPASITDWLGKLKLLQNIPFNYLVPDERMLPPESLRFFYLDFNWIYSLVDGAYSIGRSTSGDMSVDTSVSEDIHLLALQAAKQQRLSAVTNSSNPPEVVTGFLLRSDAVEGWPGIEATAYGADLKTELQLLRLERLSSGILLGIYEGELTKLNIHEPPEGMHFGFDIPDKTNLTVETLFKQLKYVDTYNDKLPGDPIQGTKTTVSFRNQNDRILDIESIAANLSTQLVNNNGQKTGEPFTAAEFALQMIEGVGLVSFTNQ